MVVGSLVTEETVAAWHQQQSMGPLTAGLPACIGCAQGLV
jgi:hypothetical protein